MILSRRDRQAPIAFINSRTKTSENCDGKATMPVESSVKLFSIRRSTLSIVRGRKKFLSSRFSCFLVDSLYSFAHSRLNKFHIPIGLSRDTDNDLSTVEPVNPALFLRITFSAFRMSSNDSSQQPKGSPLVPIRTRRRSIFSARSTFFLPDLPINSLRFLPHPIEVSVRPSEILGTENRQLRRSIG